MAEHPINLLVAEQIVHDGRGRHILRGSNAQICCPADELQPAAGHVCAVGPGALRMGQIARQSLARNTTEVMQRPLQPRIQVPARDQAFDTRHLIYLNSSHGRGAGCPAPPRTDPGVRNYRTGLLKDTRLRTPDCSG